MYFMSTVRMRAQYYCRAFISTSGGQINYQFMSTVRKRAQFYCRAFISTSGRRINYKYIIATNSKFVNIKEDKGCSTK